MLFSELRELKELLDKYNEHVAGEKAEFFLPQMFADGKWAVVIVFGKFPELSSMWEILSRCSFHMLNTWFSDLNGNIALNIQ